jgi:hypothetical protein
MEICFLHLKILVTTGYNWFQPVAVPVVHFWVKKLDPTGLLNSNDV